MLILVSISILIITPVVMIVLGHARPKFSYHWLIASGGTILAILPLVLARLRLPAHVPLISWASKSFSIQSPTLLVDQVSWPIAFSIMVIVLASLLTDVNQPLRSAMNTWVIGLFLTALGMFAVFSANLATLILAWVAADLFTYIVGQFNIYRDRVNGWTLNSLIVRLLSVGALLGAILMWSHYSQMISINNIPIQIVPLILLAAGLRIYAILVDESILDRQSTNVSNPVVLKIIPIATSGILLVRAAESGMSDTSKFIIIFVGMVISLIGGVQFLWTEGRRMNRGLWMLGFAALAIASISQNNPDAASSLVIALIFACGFMYLPGVPHRRWYFIYWLAVLAMSALPLTPVYPFGQMVTGSFQPWMFGFAISHVCLLIGFMRLSATRITSLEGAERWVTVIFTIGLGMLPIIYLSLGFFAFSNIRELSMNQSLYGVVVVCVTIALWFITRARDRIYDLPATEEFLNSLGGWFRNSIQWLLKICDDGYRYVMMAFESDGGVLWSLVLMTLLVSMLLRLE